MRQIARTAWRFWKETWRNNKPLFFAEMIGTLTGMVAATMMGVQSPNPDLITIFILYNINAVLFIYATYLRQSAWLLILMIFYLITNTIGLGRAICM